MLTVPAQFNPTFSSKGEAVKIADLLSAFLSGRSPRTLKAYGQDLADFKSFLKTKNTEEAARTLLSQGHGKANLLLLEYRTSLTARGLQSATINRRLAAVRSLAKLAKTLGLVAWSLDIQNVRTEAYRDTKGPGKSGFRSMLQTLTTKRTSKTVRDTAILRLLYDLALRTGETVALNVEDVELERGMIHVLGKGRTDKQQLTLPEPTKAALDAWMKIRGSEPGALFSNLDRAKKGCRLTGVSVYRIIRALGEKNGIKTRPHGIRHTAITEACKVAAENGIGLEEVLDFSRHSRSSVAVLMIYRDRERNIQGQLASSIAAQVAPLPAL
ncbi:MAG TPA: tyrosine-type recombinase/integrase [Verrucomicrobiae bacterium]|nr:tyrosine-type recombinase/integrase [Verrucomicrobiae bacterium]